MALQVNIRGGVLPDCEDDGQHYLKIPVNRFRDESNSKISGGLDEIVGTGSGAVVSAAGCLFCGNPVDAIQQDNADAAHEQRTQ